MTRPLTMILGITLTATSALLVQAAPTLAADSNLPTLVIIGDSTAGNQQDLGWGSHLGKYFDSARINVVNRAMAGRSSRTFQSGGTWNSVLAELKSGDFVLIQFGHNDVSPVDRPPARGLLPGLGEETQDVNKPTGGKETVHTFGWYLRKYIADTKAKGATPILLSMTVRNEWPNGKVERGFGKCSQWSAEVAKAENVLFVDAMNIIADQYDMMGQIRVAAFFPRDSTHTSAEGANLNAALVVSGLKAVGAKDFSPLLSAEGQAVTPAGENVIIKQAQDLITKPWMPEALPPSDPNLPTLFCIGDSTVRTGSKGDGGMGQWGWGAAIGDLFDRSKINVENRAMGGTSSRTFQTIGLWDKVLERIKKGDYLILQFGHNDGGAINDATAKGTLRGSGDETKDVNNVTTCQPETIHTYGWYICKYITDARAKGVTTIVCSPIPRNNWRDGKVARASQDYGKWAGEAAKMENAGFIDLNELIARRYEEMGQTRVTAICFPPREGTHTGAVGAQINATCVVEGIKSLDNCPLVGYLKSTR